MFFWHLCRIHTKFNHTNKNQDHKSKLQSQDVTSKNIFWILMFWFEILETTTTIMTTTTTPTMTSPTTKTMMMFFWLWHLDFGILISDLGFFIFFGGFCDPILSGFLQRNQVPKMLFEMFFFLWKTCKKSDKAYLIFCTQNHLIFLFQPYNNLEIRKMTFPATKTNKIYLFCNYFNIFFLYFCLLSWGTQCWGTQCQPLWIM